MIYQILQNNLIFFLLATIALGLLGLFLSGDYLKKISCLGISYSNIIILMIIVFKNSDKSKELFSLTVTILIIFSIIVSTGIAIASGIMKLEENQKNKNSILD